MLHYFDHIPEAWLELSSDQLNDHLPGPCLFEIAGRRPQPLFVSVLQHGNEPSGWDAARALLKHYSDRQLPRALSLFVGNVRAAAQQRRRLPEQPDFNRCWPGFVAPRAPDPCVNPDINQAVITMLAELTEHMRQVGPFASIDLHNTTGLNPHYGAVNRLQPEFLHLAGLFSRTVVYFTQPTGVQASAFADICPSITLECGPPGEARGTQHALELLDAALHLRKLPNHEPRPGEIDLFHTVATVRVPGESSFSFDQGQHRPSGQADISFVSDLDSLNFQELPVGTCMAYSQSRDSQLLVCNNDGKECGPDYFAWEQGELRTRRPVMPSMLTLDPDIIRQDVFCYLMERLTYQGAPQH